MHFHKYTLTEIEGMMPWEREVYVRFIMDQIKKEEAERNKR